jgi:DASH complex subunit DAD2
MGSLQQSSGQSPMLVARISEKRAELENLKQLRDLSAGLAAQMQTLEEKLSMLSDGTEGLSVQFPPNTRCSSHLLMVKFGWSTAVAAVLSNWHNVLQAINMASSGLWDSNAGEIDSIPDPNPQ